MEEHVELKHFTTFKLGGMARYFFRVGNVEGLRSAVEFAKQKGLPFFVLGGGSNLLVSDEGFSGVVIKNEIRGREVAERGAEVLVTAGAGENWDEFVATCVERGLYGLENLSGIPGTVGGAPVQNIGAYGAEVKDAIVSVETLDSKTGVVKIWSNPDCRFAYRDSFFKTKEGKRYVITRVAFRLKKNGKPNLGYKDLKNHFASARSAPMLTDVRKAVLEIRSRKFPDLATTGTAGSFFKNPIISQTHFDELKKRFPTLPSFPVLDSRHSHAFADSHRVKVPLAWILDNVLHLRGFMDGSVGLHDAQPLVIIHQGGGTALDVRRLAEDVAHKVKNATGIDIEWEVEFL